MFRRITIERSFSKAFLILTMSELAAAVGPIIDGLVIAAFYGSTGVRQFGLVNPLILAYSVLGSVFAVGSVSMCSRLIGKGKTEEARGSFSLAFFWVLTLSVFLTIILLCISTPMTQLLGADPSSGEFFSETRYYYIGLTISFPATNLLLLLNAYMQIDNDTGRTLAATLMLTGIDIAGDLLNAAILHGGMLGMGLATSVANYLALIVVLLHFAKKNAFFKPRFRNMPWKLTGKMLSNGIPAFIMLIGNTAAFVILNRILVRFDNAAALVAFTVMRSVFSIISPVAKGIGRCVMTMGGFFYGERNRSELTDLLRLLVKYTILAGGTLAVLTFLFAAPLASIFVGQSDASVLSEAAIAVRYQAFCLPFLTFAAGYESFFRGAGRLRHSMIISVLRDFILPVFFGFVLSGIWGAQGIYGALISADMILDIVILLIIASASLKKDGSFITRVFFLPPTFDIPEKDYLSERIVSMEECISLSERVEVFCQEHKMKQKETMVAALCLEEMGKNILEHGFVNPKKDMISVFVFIDEERKLNLSIRDNCRSFSPQDWEKIHREDTDCISNIGIRMTSRLAKEMRYVNLMDMNSLYIKI